MPRISNHGLGRKRTEIYPNPSEAENPEHGQNNATPGRRNQPISIPRATLTVIEGNGGSGSRIVALLEKSFRLRRLAKGESMELCRRFNESKRTTDRKSTRLN